LLRETLHLKALIFITLSVPFKPGTVNRLTLDHEFELRLLEAIPLAELVDKAYLRGRELAEGRITAQNLGLGGLVAQALRSSMQLTGLRPLVGLAVATLTLSTLKGVSDAQGRGLKGSLRQSLLYTLYRSSPDDSIKLVEGMESVGASRILSYLEGRGVTRSRISLEGLTLGHLFELLSSVDTGFMLNLRDLDLILELSRRAGGEKNVVMGVFRAYVDLASNRKILDTWGFELRSLHELLKLDRSLRSRRDELDSLIGGVYIVATLASLDRWPWI